MKLKVDKAHEELKEKSYLEIQYDTTVKWASRAAATYELAVEEKDLKRKMSILQVAAEYHHEACEHAALYEDRGELLGKVEKELESYYDKAAESLEEAINGLSKS